MRFAILETTWFILELENSIFRNGYRVFKMRYRLLNRTKTTNAGVLRRERRKTRRDGPTDLNAKKKQTLVPKVDRRFHLRVTRSTNPRAEERRRKRTDRQTGGRERRGTAAHCTKSPAPRTACRGWRRLIPWHTAVRSPASVIVRTPYPLTNRRIPTARATLQPNGPLLQGHLRPSREGNSLVKTILQPFKS